MEYEIVVGLEVHAQLKTQTKIFCGCKNEFGAAPNTHICPVCLGLPGALPVMNRQALEFVVKAGMALDCDIARSSKMDRKNYFYPDLPKAYQISQFDQPVCIGGTVYVFTEEGGERDIQLERIHIEEDAGKNIHEDAGVNSLVDYNRAGVPLAEIVSTPDIHSSAEAFEYLTNLKAILEYAEVSDCNMQEGSLRCDANISIRPKGETELGTKTEVKNMNSFRGVQKAIDYEVKRQKEVLASGGRIVQETRLWDAAKEITLPMRSKEGAHDYRYFPEPDLLMVDLSDEQYLQKLKDSLPELPQQRKERFEADYALPAYDAGVLTAQKALADYFEAAVKLCNEPKTVSNWVMGEVLKELNKASLEISQCKVSAEDLVELIACVTQGQISHQVAKTVFEEMFASGDKAAKIIEQKGLAQINDSDELKDMIAEIIEQNPKSVEDFKAGNKKAMGFFVGQVMYRSKGKANPKLVGQIVQDLLK